MLTNGAAAGTGWIADADQVRIGTGLQRVELKQGEVLQKWGMTCGSLHCFVSDRQSLGVLQMEVISQRGEQAG